MMLPKKAPMLGLAAFCFQLAGGALAAPPDAALPVDISVDLKQPGSKVSPDFYGLMTEEINHAFDGGLYAELIRNRNFKNDPSTAVDWSLVQSEGASGQMALSSDAPATAALPQSLNITITLCPVGQRVGAANGGYWGIPVKPKTAYRASFFAQAADGFAGPVTVSLESADGSRVYAKASVQSITSHWQRYALTLTTGQVPASLDNRVVISGAHPGTLRLSLASLFPPTYNNRPNGTRIDLMQKMAALKPAFLRMPGGNYVDPGHFLWKNTIGPIEQRPGSPGAWSYRITEGLGLLEMLEWCEDLHMQPLLAVSDGRSWLKPEEDVTPLVQDALDEIEYVMGSPKTPWGLRRAKDGHPAPFPLRYVEIGNEDFFDRSGAYNMRFAKFYDAIKAKYPQLKIIATRGDVTGRVPDIIDDHYYRSARSMESNAHQYDTVSRTGPKIFVGEWATTEGSPTPTMNSALGDAAWLTGLERNADIVLMESYAPLLVNVNPGARQWRTNLIGYDALSSFGSPAYYVQRMFASHHGNVTLPTNVRFRPAPAAAVQPVGGVGLGTWNTQAEFKDVSVTSGDSVLAPRDPAHEFAEWTTGAGDWKSENDTLTQTGTAEYSRAAIVHPEWTNYTFRAKARKLSGAEGFLVSFHLRDNDNYIWWNLGGWGNTASQLERNEEGSSGAFGPRVPMTIETGRWYDLRVELNGSSIACYLDDKLVLTATDAPSHPERVFASASRDTVSGDVFLHLVNTDAMPQPINVTLSGGAFASAAGEILSGNPDNVNSIAQPKKVVPHPLTLNHVGSPFAYTLPAHSVAVLRLKAK